MDKLIEHLFDFDKISAKLVILIWATSGILLIPNTTLLAILRLEEFLNEYGKYVGITFLCSTGFLLVTIYSAVTNKFAIRRFNNRQRESFIQVLKELDSYEKAVLREYVIQGCWTLMMPTKDSSVIGLESKHLITRISTTPLTFKHGQYFQFSISRIVLEILSLNPNFVDMPTLGEGIDAATTRRINKARPEWVYDKESDDLI